MKCTSSCVQLCADMYSIIQAEIINELNDKRIPAADKKNQFNSVECKCFH